MLKNIKTKQDIQSELLEVAQAEIRIKRNELLADVDYLNNMYSDLDQPVPQEWKDYRNALRDITKQSGFPKLVKGKVVSDVVFPTKPE